VTANGKRPGRMVSGRGFKAFVPDPLPRELSLDTKVVRALSDADRQIGLLAGEGRRLPNPHLLVRPFVRREAVLSSRIEGTQSTLGELLAREAGAAIERSPDDLREVANYVAALEFGIDRLRELPLSLRLVKELHARLMSGVRGETATPGEFRRSQNWIGPAGCTLATATYVPPPPEQMTDCLGDWESFLHERAMPPLVQVALAHSQFEMIHPFLDGNGRVGRLLITLFLVEREILPTPLLYLSAFFEATRAEYYDALEGVSSRGEWDAWLIYFLSGVARQSEDACGRAERINALLTEWREAAAGLPSNTPRRMVDLLAANPFVTVRGAADRLEVAFTTAQRAVARLEEMGIVKEVTDAKRDRVYCAEGILSILDEPPKLAP